MTRDWHSTRLMAVDSKANPAARLHLWGKFLQREWNVTVFLMAVSVCGLLFGGIVAGQLSPAESFVLVNRVQSLLSAIHTHQFPPSQDVLWQRLISDGRLLALLWVLGLSVIGIPFILVTLFLRAFSIGFAIGFTVLHFGWNGLWISLLGIFTHQFLAYTTLLIAALIAIRFSMHILRQSFALPSLLLRVFRYTGAFVACLGGLAVADFVQIFIAPHLLVGLLH
ncbi:MAG: stage II sporulation protein M [Alicyclobacillaceae bacterium]|nr:stage II sporulation protein M [Alicyclobacillaceae bacterium]